MFAETMRVGQYTMVVLADIDNSNTRPFSSPQITAHKVISMFEAGMLVQNLAVILTENGNDVGELIRQVLEHRS